MCEMLPKHREEWLFIQFLLALRVIIRVVQHERSQGCKRMVAWCCSKGRNVGTE